MFEPPIYGNPHVIRVLLKQLRSVIHGVLTMAHLITARVPKAGSRVESLPKKDRQAGLGALEGDSLIMDQGRCGLSILLERARTGQRCT